VTSEIDFYSVISLIRINDITISE